MAHFRWRFSSLRPPTPLVSQRYLVTLVVNLAVLFCMVRSASLPCSVTNPSLEVSSGVEERRYRDPPPLRLLDEELLSDERLDLLPLEIVDLLVELGELRGNGLVNPFGAVWTPAGTTAPRTAMARLPLMLDCET
jgi:hypothetical protein